MSIIPPERKERRARPGLLMVIVLIAGIAAPALAHGRHRNRTVGISIGAYFPIHVYGFSGAYYPMYYPVGVYVPSPGRPYYAFVDTDIHPEDAHVYLDGKLIGVADDFDGYPGYLAVKPGRHTIGFTYEGYHSLSLELNLRAGELVDIDRKLPRLARGDKDRGLPPVPTSDRIHRPGRESEGTGSSTGREPETRGDYGTLRLRVTPPEARVVLDGDFFGTGAEISRLHGGIPLSPGAHQVRVSLEGYRSESADMEIVASEERTVQIRLQER